ncbi:hypothetical protein SK128_027020 [Halocaridina rubra]|uniref:Uncharacterized protein n=1 Tax=Halocaridina rubra TaxID=373956 RepID=A0AAN8XX73_HALRR
MLCFRGWVLSITVSYTSKGTSLISSGSCRSSLTCQGTILEESLGRSSGEKGRGPGIREVLEYICPQLSVGCLRLGQATPQTEEALLRLDDLGIS